MGAAAEGELCAERPRNTAGGGGRSCLSVHRPLPPVVTRQVRGTAGLASPLSPNPIPQMIWSYRYGHLTWEWAAGLRGYAHPVLYGLPYWLLRLLRADAPWTIMRAPQLVQAVFAALTDHFVIKTTSLLFGYPASRWAAGWLGSPPLPLAGCDGLCGWAGPAGCLPQTASRMTLRQPGARRWAMACQLGSWFNAYALVRTYSNSLEACFTAAGAFYWLHSRRCGTHERPPGSSDQQLWLVMAALCVVFRPSSALFWLLPAALELVGQRSAAKRLRLLGHGLAVGGACLALSTLLDRWCYGRWVLAPWEFLKFNLLSGGSAQYGSHPWHWNFTQGFPVVALTLLPLLLVGLGLRPWQ